MKNLNDEIVIDPNSGISVEEQNEILLRINGITEQNKQKLSENLPKAGKKIKIDAKKKGILFPLLVNIAAVVLLCAGIVLLISFNRNVDARIRTGSDVFSLTERALIEEIRRDTAEQVAVKDMEIALINSRMEEIDEEILQLLTNNISLSADQMATRERLLAQQESFRNELNSLHDERSQILENSRAREARLRAQLEERTREFTAELDTAMAELERLTNEQERIAAIDAHLTGGIASTAVSIQNGQYDEAVRLVASLRDFLNSGNVISLRSFQSRRENYLQTLNLMEVMIINVRRSSGEANPVEHLDLLAANADLLATIGELERTISSVTAGGSAQVQRIRELEENVSSLNQTLSSERQTSAEKDVRITALQNENENLHSNVTRLNSEVTTITATVAGLRNENTNLTATETRLRNENAALEQRIVDLDNQLTAIRQVLMELAN